MTPAGARSTGRVSAAGAGTPDGASRSQGGADPDAAAGAEGPHTQAAPNPDAAARRRGRGAASWDVDMHMHTSASYDCLSAPRDVVERAREAGLERIAITDHDEIEGALEARQIDAELVIVGEEVSTGEGPDLIGLFLHRRIPPGWPFRDVADAIHAQGGLVYLPHPFDGRRGADPELLERVADCIDVVEGFNARVHDPAANRRARQWARRRELPVGAGSDAHLLSEIGRGRVQTPPFRDPPGFMDALRRGRISGRPSGRWVHLGSTWAKIRKRLP